MTTIGPHPAVSITVPCVICLHKVPLTAVTAGSLYADGTQAFACSSHLVERSKWITAWAVFDQKQRQLHEISALAESLQ